MNVIPYRTNIMNIWSAQIMEASNRNFLQMPVSYLGLALRPNLSSCRVDTGMTLPIYRPALGATLSRCTKHIGKDVS
jgi:hypothetical protein